MRKKDGSLDMRYKQNKEDDRGVVSKKLYDNGKPTVAIPIQTQLIRTLQDIQTYQWSVRAAENIQAPNRLNLYRLYKDVKDDAQVSTVMMSRKNALLHRQYNVVGPDGEIDLDKTKRLNTGSWLFDFIDYAMDSIFYGFSLIQFDIRYDFMGNMIPYDFTIDVVPREYVVPEYNLVVPAMGMFSGGIDFRSEPYKYWNIPV